MRRWIPREDGASLCGGRSGGGLRGQPGVDTSLESSSCAVEGDRLAVRKMHSAADDTGAAGHEVLICDAAYTFPTQALPPSPSATRATL